MHSGPHALASAKEQAESAPGSCAERKVNEQEHRSSLDVLKLRAGSHSRGGRLSATLRGLAAALSPLAPAIVDKALLQRRIG